MRRLGAVTLDRIPFTSRGGADNYPLETALWTPEGEVRAVVQILHGMAEHIARYDRLARALCARGYAVAGHDHRGHGQKCPEDKIGYCADQNGWSKVVGDAHQETLLLKNRFPGKKLILLGHSMGSFLAREYVLRYGGDISALVLSGTGYYGKALCAAGGFLAKLCPPKKPSKLVDSIAFSANNKPFKPARTGFDWLSRDEKEVDKYVADARCGFIFTARAFGDFFGGLKDLTKTERLAAIDPALPILIISGDNDPVGGMGAGVKSVYDEYKRAGLKHVTMKLYPGARHEIFNETNRDEVTNDLADWLDGQCGEAE